MARAAFVLPIRPGMVDQYVAAHSAVSPEMLDALRQSGVRNYSIYLRQQEAIGYFEADDPAAALKEVEKSPANTRWQERMAPLLEQPLTAGGPALLPEIFRMD